MTGISFFQGREICKIWATHEGYLTKLTVAQLVFDWGLESLLALQVTGARRQETRGGGTDH